MKHLTSSLFRGLGGFLLLCFGCLHAQTIDTAKWWHDKQRVLRYHPEGQDIVITNGNRRFTRALYGTNTAFRVEAGDLPEFALYMPGMGGNIKFGLISKDSSKWLINAGKIVAGYRAGSMNYTIEDPMLGKGKIQITVLAMADAEGVIMKVSSEHITAPVELVWAYGGATAKKFSRDGDMGPDPESSFYLKPEYCTDNKYSIEKDNFLVTYGTGEILSEADRYENRNLPGDKIKPQKGKEQLLNGVYPTGSTIKLVDAAKQTSPNTLYPSTASVTPAIAGKVKLQNADNFFFCFQAVKDLTKQLLYAGLPDVFTKAEAARKVVAERIRVITPDPYINTVGGALSIAADAIWEEPSYLHGSIGWRIRLNGWRGAYTGDVFGWHDRARMHFRAYALSQVTSPDSGKVVSDTALHLARQMEKMGTSVFSSGYISRNPGGDQRPHHYDMNLVYIDELLWHFRWTGDLAFVKEMWPLIKRHLAWEKRNFDSDNNGLYDAYAAIWASDALEYSGGSVTHSSAYNYRANKMAAELAALIGEDPEPYRKEAAKIIAAVNHTLWMPDKGWYAEYKDTMGLKLLHPAAALWTVYHAIDSDVPDAFKAYQSLQYIDDQIPHIPVRAKGLAEGYYTLSTSNWMPYEWSLNNVALAELMHTSLANWQTGRNEEAFLLWKSALLESMYLGGSPGNFQQISTYDAIRGEAYRDFADPVGMTARSMVQGLFGILPDALHKELTIQPGFPANWKHASLQTPDIQFAFKRDQRTDTYTILPSFQTGMRLSLLLKVNGSAITSILVNGKKAVWQNVDSAVGSPMIRISAGMADKYRVTIVWQGSEPDSLPLQKTTPGDDLFIHLSNAMIKQVYDPQGAVGFIHFTEHDFDARVAGAIGKRTIFLQLKQGQFSWWQPVRLSIKDPIDIVGSPQQQNSLAVTLINNTSHSFTGKLMVNGDSTMTVTLTGFSSKKISLPSVGIIPGGNRIVFYAKNLRVPAHATIRTWNFNQQTKQSLDLVDMSQYFNDKVTHIFTNQYLSPRPKTATLQLPTQGIGEWTHPLLTAVINDSGFRKMAANGDRFTLPQGISFQTPSDTTKHNILFTSQWDNYPKEARVPLSGRASHAYLLMAGSTNPMQSRITNGAVIISYTDGSSDTLLLKNPETWWPIEQDYYDDGYAFTINAARPVRIHLKSGEIVSDLDNSIAKYNGKMIDGGAATVLDLPLSKEKELKALKLQTLANDVVIGLMSITLLK